MFKSIGLAVMFGGTTLGSANPDLPAFATPTDDQLANVIAEGGADPRRSVSRIGDGAWLAAIGGTYTNSNVPVPREPWRQAVVDGTAFRISPCLILTNYHTVFGASSQPDRDSYTNTFISISPAGDVYLRHQALPVVWGPMNLSAESKDDWAILELEEGGCVDSGWLQLQPLAIEDIANTEVTLAGYPTDRPRNSLTAHVDCLLVLYDHPSAPETILHRCATRPGSSGSPLIVQPADGPPFVIGIHQGSINEVDTLLFAYDDSIAGIAIGIQRVLDGAGPLIDADLARQRQR